jgi:hypothetical protein
MILQEQKIGCDIAGFLTVVDEDANASQESLEAEHKPSQQ